MKKTDFLEIHFQALPDFKTEVTQALSSGRRLCQPGNRVVFDSIASFRSFMTIQKIEILTAIAIRKPASVYELAKMMDRDFAAVFRDCTGLESTGFITLKSTRDPRRTKTPKLRFPYQGMAIFMPESPYHIEFGRAA